MRLVNNKALDLPIKKLAKDSPPVREKFIEAGADVKQWRRKGKQRNENKD